MVYDSSTGKVILFGGSGDTDLNDTWAYDPAANIWTNLKPSGDLPSARDGHSMVYDSSTGKVILFGGSNESDPTFNDTWAYDPVGNTWTNLNPSGSLPSGRVGHSMVYDPTTGKVILFGGLGEQGIFDDIWAYGVTP
jgi:N-acetylneuraminic acid mutarotase